MDLIMLLISLGTGLGSFLSAYFLYTSVKAFRVRHLNLIILGMIMQGLLAISFIPQSFLIAEQYEFIMTLLNIIGAILTLTGLTLITWNLRIHHRGNVPQRFLFILVFYGVAISQIITGTSVQYTTAGWAIERSGIVRLVMFAATFWIIVELTLVFVESLKNSLSQWSITASLYPLGIIVSLVLLALRENLSLPLTFYQIPAAVGIAGLAVALYKDPTVLIQSDTEISSVVLASRDSGITNISYPYNTETDNHSHLNTAAITGISNIIQEIAGKSELPPSLGYVDYQIGIYPGQSQFIYTISDGSHPLMEGILNYILKKWDNRQVMHGGSVEPELVVEFENDIIQNLSIFLPRTLPNI